jgi:pimeloyl-ACP methyl ester carboxylesterase
MAKGRRTRRALAALVIAGALCAGFAGQAAAKTPISFQVIDGYKSPGTPKNLNKVGILKVGDPKAKNVLVLNPGTSAGAGYFLPLAKTVVARQPRWQVWSVERRENFLEDQSELNKAKRGEATAQDVFDYYLGYITDGSITNHVHNVQDADVPFARDWGMKVEVNDLHRVVKRAAKGGRNVVMGGHSLGGSIVTAYATWNFNGKPGADDLSGLVLIDGASSTTPITKADAEQRLSDLQSGSPWLNFGGISAPFAGLFGTVGSSLTKLDPDGPSILGDWAALPPNLKTPVPATNEAGFGYDTDVATSPSSLIAAQVHSGHLRAAGDPRGWVRGGAITPIQRWASMFSGWDSKKIDGTAWYHPLRLTIDAGAIGNGIKNPAQKVLDVDATKGKDLSPKLRIYAFGAALGDERVPAAAKALAKQSGIPRSHLTLLARGDTYAHNDPNSAAPAVNEFLDNLGPFLRSTK